MGEVVVITKDALKGEKGTIMYIGELENNKDTYFGIHLEVSIFKIKKNRMKKGIIMVHIRESSIFNAQISMEYLLNHSI